MNKQDKLFQVSNFLSNEIFISLIKNNQFNLLERGVSEVDSNHSYFFQNNSNFTLLNENFDHIFFNFDILFIIFFFSHFFIIYILFLILLFIPSTINSTSTLCPFIFITSTPCTPTADR